MTQGEVERIADSIVARQWRYGRNTRLAAGLGVIMLLLLVIPVVLALAERQTAGRPFGGVGGDDAQVYAQVLAGSSGSGRVYVYDRFCDGMTDIDSGERGACYPGAIMPAVQQRIRAVTGTRVVFTARPPQPGPAVVMHLGTALIVGDRAAVAYDLECGPLCGHGETAVFTRLDGVWARTGTAPGYRWIS